MPRWRPTISDPGLFGLLWASLHLDDLRRLEHRLAAPAEAFARD